VECEAYSSGAKINPENLNLWIDPVFPEGSWDFDIAKWDIKTESCKAKSEKNYPKVPWAEMGKAERGRSFFILCR